MPYCVKADLVRRFGAAELAQLTDETAAQSPDDTEINEACEEASSLIDSYLATRYAVPVDPVPTMVRKWACDIARKYVWKSRADAEHPVTLAFNAALAQLKDVAKGIAALPDSTGEVATVTGGIAYTAPGAVFDTTGLL